jgi:hypothetical protein
MFEYDGQLYSCKRWNIEIPDLDGMSRLAARVWINQNTSHRTGMITP